MNRSRWRVCVDSLTPIRNLAGDLLDTAGLRRWRFDRPTRHRLLLGCRRAFGDGRGFALAPMSYLGSRTGQQFVVIATGGHLMLNAKGGDSLIAYALPQ